MKEIEEWKDVPGYLGYYQISNLGRVKSLNRTIVYSPSKFYPNGRVRVLKEKILTPSVDKKGYEFVQLFINGNYRSKKIHRLVAEVFIPNPNNLEQVNHKDENKKNNKVSNLEWCTLIYNINYGTGKYRKTLNKRIPVVQYDLDGNMIREYESATAATKVLNIKQGSSRGILETRRGKHKYMFGYIWKFKHNQ